jgi:lipopolysaccharide transport system permease protein
MTNVTKTVIKPKSHYSFQEIGDLWLYRELLWVFIWRDLKVRYKQTALGILWVIFQPLLSMIVFTVFFGKLAKIPSGNLPYALFSLIGLTFWNLFSNSISKVSDSIVANEGILKKIYFPRLILPVSAIGSCLVDFLVNSIFLVIFSIVLGYIPSLNSLVVIPLLALVTSITALGGGLILSSMNVKYRDVRYILPFFIQISMFLTPVIYPLSIVGQTNRLFMAINPMTSVIEVARWLFSGGQFYHSNVLLISAVSALVLIVVGIIYFKITEDSFTDIV